MVAASFDLEIGEPAVSRVSRSTGVRTPHFSLLALRYGRTSNPAAIAAANTAGLSQVRRMAVASACSDS